MQAAQQQVEEVKATLKQSAQAQADATTDKSAAETKQAELAQQLESAQQSSEQLRSSNTDLAQQLAEARSGRTDMKADLKAVKGQLQAAQQQAGQLKEANADLTQQLEQAVSRKSSALDHLAKKKAEAAELDEEVQCSHRHVESIQADLDRVTKQLQVSRAASACVNL